MNIHWQVQKRCHLHNFQTFTATFTHWNINSNSSLPKVQVKVSINKISLNFVETLKGNCNKQRFSDRYISHRLLILKCLLLGRFAKSWPLFSSCKLSYIYWTYCGTLWCGGKFISSPTINIHKGSHYFLNPRYMFSLSWLSPGRLVEILSLNHPRLPGFPWNRATK